MSVTRRKWLRAVVIALYAMAVAALGFGHRPPAVFEAVDGIGLAAHDATLLCLSHAGGEPPHVSPAHCDACLLTSAPGLVSVPTAIPIEFRVSQRARTAPEIAWAACSVASANRARAPPGPA
jgi:hypothetical protein